MNTSYKKLFTYKTILPYLFNIVLGSILYLILSYLYQYQCSIQFIIVFSCIVFFVSLCLTNLLFQIQTNKINKKYSKQLSVLRHDVKGLLSPALLQADRILLNKSADQKTLQSAESIANSIEKTSNYLNSTKKD